MPTIPQKREFVRTVHEWTIQTPCDAKEFGFQTNHIFRAVQDLIGEKRALMDDAFEVATGDDEGEEVSLEEDMRARFGDEKTDQYLVGQKAVRALVSVAFGYFAAEPNSPDEDQLKAAYAKMTDDLKQSPGHAVFVVQDLLAIIAHLDAGGTLDGWFERVGL